MSFLQFPLTITYFMDNQSSAAAWIEKWLSPTGTPGVWVYAAFNIVLIIFFTYFYTSVTFNPVEVAQNMKANGGFIPGIRPGKATIEYLNRVMTRITFVGALFLAAVAILPTVVSQLGGLNFHFGGTSLLIAVGVALDTMKQLEKEQASLAVNVVGAFAAQEEVGTRGAVVTSQIVKPDLAIVFEGSPSDDFFISAGQAQGCMKKGVQIRILDNSYISNTQFISLAEEVAAKCGIKYQESVRRGGSTNAAKISVTGKAVPCLVLGVPSRYAHSHYNFCAKEDLEAASAMAANVIRALDEEKIRHICHQDVL